MSFAQPVWLVVGGFVCLGLGFLFRYLRKKRQAALAEFAAHQLVAQLTRNVSARKRRYKNLLLLFAVFCMFIALARPQYGHQWVEVKRKGIDLLFALDTSRSMLAEDMKPNRLQRSYFAILDFVQQLGGDRVGLLPFAGSAYLMCPLTMDYEAFEQSLAAVDTNLIPTGGTNIAGVINKAKTLFADSANHKILIIITDGESLEGDTIQAAKEAKEVGMTIYTVGVGTSSGELIPLPGGQGFVKDSAGNFVTSRLDEETLKAIAAATDGLYVPLGAAGEGLETIYQEKLSRIPKEELAERRHKVPVERFEWPLAAALILLVLEFIQGERKGSSIGRNLGRSASRAMNRVKKLRAKSTDTKESRSSLQTTAMLFIILFNFPAAYSYASKGEEAFNAGDYLQASEYYSKRLEQTPDDPTLHYNYGTAAFKNNMYDDAIDSFSRALKSDDLGLQAKSYFNKANSHFMKGRESVQGETQKTVEEWKQALKDYSAALELAPEDKKIQQNYDLVKKQLEELEKQQKQQQQQNQDQNQDKNQNQDQQQNQQNQQGGQGDQDKKESQGQQENEQDNSENSQQDASRQEKQEPQAQTGDQGDQDEQKQKDQQAQPKKPQEQPGEKKDEEKDGEIAAANQQKQDEEENKNAQDALRRQQGKMTREEAEQLLNALKNEEGELNFVPAAKDDQPQKNW